MNSAALYWLSLVLYSLVMLLAGVVIRRRTRADQAHAGLEYWMAKRQLPGWMLAVSLTSGWLMLGWIGFGMSQIYMYGATALWILNIPWFILCIIVIAIVPLVRRVPSVSIPQAIGRRFGPSARILVALCSAFVFIAWTQAELFMGGALIAPFLQAPKWVCMVALVAPVLIYMAVGGFRVVILTDQIQFGIMAVFMVVLGVWSVQAAGQASHGQILQALANAAPPLSGKGHVYDLWFLGGLFPLVLLAGYLPGWLMEQDLTLRIQAAPTTREAYKGAVYSWGLISVFVLAIPTLVAACAMVAFPAVDGKAPDAIGADALGIVSAFVSQMPLPLAVFMVLGIIACQMSTVDTFANVAALAVGYDLIDPTLRKRQPSPRNRLRVARWATIGVLLLSLVSAIYSDSLKDVYYISSGVLSASVAIPAIFIYWRRATSLGVLASAVVGTVGTVGGYWYEYKYLQAADANAPHYYTNVLPGWMQNSYGYNYMVAGVLLSLAAIVLLSFITPRPTTQQLSQVEATPVDDFSEFATATGEAEHEATAGPSREPAMRQ